jgi:protein SCO1/2
MCAQRSFDHSVAAESHRLGRYDRYSVQAYHGDSCVGGCVRLFSRFGIVLFLLTVTCLAAHAQLMDSGKPLGAAAQGDLPQYLKDAGVEQRLNQFLPLTASFVDEGGNSVTLGSLFHGRPVALALVYFKCAMLCPQVLHGLQEGLRASGFAVGKDFDVVVASIDPMDSPADASKAKQDFLAGLRQNGTVAEAGVHFLTGQPPAIAALSAATGFHYVRVPGPDGKMDQFAHSSVIMFATPDGRLSEYLSGIDYPARDVRLALVNASNRKIASVKDLVLLYCCNYVPSAGRYTVAVLRLLSFAGMIMLLGMGTGLYFLVRSGRAPHSGATA